MARGGLVQVETGLGSRVRIGGSNFSGPPSTGASKLAREIAGDLAGVGDRIGKLADAAAAAEGAKEGRAAGLDPEFRTRQDQTIRSEAFNRAGLDVAETQHKVSLDGQIEALREKHAGDPQALETAIAGIASGTLPNVPEELRPKIGQFIQSKRLAYMREAAREQAKRAEAEQAAALQADVTASLRGIQQKAFLLGLDPEADAAIGRDMAALGETLSRKAVDGAPLVDPGKRESYLAAARVGVVEARALGAFDRLEGAAAKAEFLAKLEDDFKHSRGLAGELNLDEFRSLQQALSGEMARAEARRNVAARDLDRRVKSVVDLAGKGFAPRADDMAQLASEIAASGDGEMTEALKGAEAALKWQGGARAMTPRQLDGWLSEERARVAKDGATPGDVARLEMGERVLGEMRKGLKEDPIEWSARAGYGPGTPLDFSAPDKFAASLAARIPEAEEIGERYEQEPVYLRPEDRKRLIAMAAPGGPALIDTVEALTRGGGDRAERLMAEMWSEAPALAVAGGHASRLGRTRVLDDLADGVGLLRVKGIENLAPRDDDARRWAASAHKGALAGLPRTEQSLIAATNYAYNVRLQQKKKVEDADLWRQTFRELAGEREVRGETYGGFVTRRGGALAVPVDVRQDGFDDLMEAIRIDDFGTAPPRTRKGVATASDIRNARPVQVGDGIYRLNLGDEDAPQWLVDGNDRPFELDLNALKPVLRARVPQVYLDGGR